MKTTRLILLIVSLLGLFSVMSAAERSNVQCLLISASNEKGQTDRRLASYEPTLRRILRFESYRFLGEDRASVAVNEKSQLSIGNGHQLELTGETSGGGSIHLKVRWTQGGRTLMNTGLALRPGVPAVLGGPSTGNKGEVYAVILVGR
jgi:hypothetical protein